MLNCGEITQIASIHARVRVLGARCPVATGRRNTRAAAPLPALPRCTRHVTTFADAPFDGPEFAGLLIAGGKLTWSAGPLAKGSNLCHGTGGNGYAFLKLYRRTRDARWLQRARAFAMTAISQCREARLRYGRGRYSLWTGDLGLAVYLRDCLSGEPAFPTVDIF